MSKVEIEESTVYENCIGVKEVDYNHGSLCDLLGIEDEHDDEKEWKKHWIGMPEYEQEDNPPFKKIYVSFRTEEDYQEFAKLIGQKLTNKTKSIWHPKLDRDANTLKRWIEIDD